MNWYNTHSKSHSELKNRVERLLEENPLYSEVTPSEEVQSLIKDLWNNQVELKSRNQQLHMAYEDLEKSKKHFEYLLESASMGYLTLDEKNTILDVNYTGSILLDTEKKHLLGKSFLEFVSADNVDRFYYHREKCLESKKTQTCNLKLKRKGKNQRYVKLESLVVLDPEGKFSQIEIAILDITDQKKADERIKSLSRELLRSQETERRMIARELHDRVAQELSAVKMGYDSLTEGNSDISGEIRQKLSALSKILQKTIKAVRDLSYELRPPGLEKSGIIQSLFDFCSEFSQKSGVHVDFFSVGMETIELDDFTMINIYRLVQEGLNNVFKHAQASHVDVMFSYSHPDIVLRITDNGKGFDVEKRLAALTSEKRMGLRSMQERVTLLAGTMSVQSMPMYGTKIYIKLPYGNDVDG